MFEQLIDSYVRKLDAGTIIKFANNNGIELSFEEGNEAYIFIQKYYKVVLYNRNEQLLESLMRSELKPESYDKLKQVLILARRKFCI